MEEKTGGYCGLRDTPEVLSMSCLEPHPVIDITVVILRDKFDCTLSMQLDCQKDADRKIAEGH